jgi:hypothetical protein
MKVTLKKIIEAQAALSQLTAQPTEDMAAPFKLGAITNALRPLVEQFNRDSQSIRDKLKETYNPPLKEDGSFTPTPEHEAEFQKQIQPILDEEVSVHIPYKIKLADLERAKIKINGNQAALLMWLIVAPDSVTSEAEPAEAIEGK